MSKMNAQSTFLPLRNNSSNGLSTPALDDHSLQAEARKAGMFGFIAALSFLLNSLFCVIMMKKPAMLKRPHNILLFSLAITDLLTGLLLYSLLAGALFLVFADARKRASASREVAL